MSSPGFHPRLFANYLVHAEERFRLWMGDKASVRVVSDETLLVTFGGRAVELTFLPESCRWSLRLEGAESMGNFDKVTKQARKLLTQERFV